MSLEQIDDGVNVRFGVELVFVVYSVLVVLDNDFSYTELLISRSFILPTLILNEKGEVKKGKEKETKKKERWGINGRVARNLRNNCTSILNSLRPSGRLGI